jgi:hypothetical protein
MENVIGAFLVCGLFVFIGYFLYVKRFSKTGKFFWSKWLKKDEE